MEEKINTFIVDGIMGCGKSSAAINAINASSPDDKYMVITPYLDEVQRYKHMCPSKHFKEPMYKGGSKLDNIKDLIRNGHNIVSTHALFHKFDREIINIIETLGYKLIMDEVTDVVEEYDITIDDIENLKKNYCNYDKETGRLIWREEKQKYRGKFSEVKNMCNTGSVVLTNNCTILLWLFPVEVFKAFEEVYILTYMFNAQIQRYYFDYHKLKYKNLYVAGDSVEEYRFTDVKSATKHKYNYSELINVLDHYKLNIIGKDWYALSKTWFNDNNGTAVIKQLQNNVVNFFRNIACASSDSVLWSTFKDYQKQLSGKGYTKGFLSINARATNLYKERTALAYLANRFCKPMIKKFFVERGVDVDEDGYALSEMLQWIWRSAIREGNKIQIYIPSSRMRGLLIKWIAENSI